MNKIKVLALIGESGAGKDAFMQEILKQNEFDFNEIVSCTSRPQREKEVYGVHYYFYDKDEFLAKVRQGDMFEYTEFNGWMYGTGKDSILKNKINIGVFNPTGVRSLLSHPELDVFVVQVRASAKTRLLRQLNRQDNPDVDEIVRRYRTDKEDFSTIDFDKLVLQNEHTTLEELYSQLEPFLRAWAEKVN